MIQLDPIRTNLNLVTIEGQILVFSYKTHVGTIIGDTLFLNPPYYWSQTTSRHLNQLCDDRNLKMCNPLKPQK